MTGNPRRPAAQPKWWSGTVRALRGDGRDERFALIDLRATAFAGLVSYRAARRPPGTASSPVNAVRAGRWAAVSTSGYPAVRPRSAARL